MFGNGKFDQVIKLVKDWRPKKDYGHESKFQKELQEFLDEELSKSDSGMMAGMGNQKEDVVKRERGKSRGDVVVNDKIGIELKRDLTNSQVKKLRGQIEDYLDNYNQVIVCACGIKDKDGWKELKNKYEGKQGGVGAPQKEVVFIWKKKENYGKKKKSKKKTNKKQGGLLGGQSGDNPFGV